MKNGFSQMLIWGLVAALLIGLAAGCSKTSAPAQDGRLDVVVSITPQKYFVERIGGEHVNVSVMVEPGADVHTFEPKPEQMRVVSRAAAYFSIGVEFEHVWLAKIVQANPDMRVVDTIAGIQRMPMTAHHHHEQEDEEEHEEGALDPHVWLSPELVKVQAQAIYAALVELDPAHAVVYKANLDAFVADIDGLEAEIRATLSGLKSAKFMVFHPAWGYFARDFGLEQIPVEVGGQEPSAQELAGLIREAQEEGIRVVFAQPEFSSKAAETIAKEIGGEVLLISPLPVDWLEDMRRVAQTLAEVLNQ